MPFSAVLLDLDGVLLDSNAVHAEAWRRAARAAGLDTPRARLDEGIGMGGDRFVPEVFGADVEAAQGEGLREAYTMHVRSLLAAHPVGVFPGAEALVAAARARGLALALATSAGGDDLDHLFSAAGLDLRPRLDAVVTSSDADHSKPAPDVVAAACDRLGVDPAAAVLVGDTVFDGAAASRAGAAFVGVATWVWDEPALRAAGAAAVLPSTAALAAAFGGVLDALDRARPRLAGEPR